MALFRTGGGGSVTSKLANLIADATKFKGSADAVYTTTTGTAADLTNVFTVGKSYLMFFVAVDTTVSSISTMTFEGAVDTTPQAYRLLHRITSGSPQERSYIRVIKATATTIKVTVPSGIKFGVRFLELD